MKRINKNMKKIYSLVFTVAVIMIAACKPGDFGDVNVSPTIPASAPAKSLLTNSLQSLPGTVFGNSTANFYVQYLSEGPYPGASLYNGKNFSWNGYYAGPMFNLQTIIDYNNANSALASESVNGAKVNQLAVARILKAYYFWFLTDRYGNIPYTEALKGGGDFTPKYDTQQSIYYALFTELKQAHDQINVNAAGVTGDILFNGDMAMWKKFANTTRLFMALRLIKNDYTKGKTEFAAAITDGVLTSNADNVVYSYIGSDPNNWNPWYANYTVSNRNDYAISKTLVDYMGPKADPRLPLYGETGFSGGTSYLGVKGLAYGSSSATNIPYAYSRIGDAFRSAGSPAYVYSYAQVSFALAEGAKVAYITGGDAQAQIHYENGIAASWDQNGVYDATAFATYIAQSGVAYSAATGLKQIIEQKWVHQYLNGYEAWADWRRTGFPVLTPAGSSVDARGIPRRQGYPSNEGAINGSNYSAVVTAQGVDDNYTKMWWDL